MTGKIEVSTDYLLKSSHPKNIMTQLMLQRKMSM